MKRLIIFLLVAVAAQATAWCRTFVLATGVSNYNDAQNNLTLTTKDAKRFRHVMQKHTNDISLLTSSNVTRQNVLAKLKAIAAQARKGDRIIFFYSGHGVPGALYGYNGPIPYDDIINAMKQSPAQKFLFIEACHAGSLKESTPAANGGSAIRTLDGQAFFLSSRAEEASLAHTLLGAGYFSKALVKGLQGAADKNSDRQITVLELFRYIYGDVMKHSAKQQHPQLIAPESMHQTVVMSW